MIIKKLKESNLDQTFDVTEKKNDFKIMLSKIESQLKSIQEELSESIKQMYDQIN